jgi:glycosyltransferase involved in cell wall biosynthesis
LKIAFMLLHDFKFAGWSLEDFLDRHHFSKEYSRRLAERGHEVALYILHQDAEAATAVDREGFVVKVFPSQFSFPPVPGFGYAHNLQVTKELAREKPEIIHFNNYYLWNFPYVARWARRNGVKMVCQYHGASDFLRPVRKAFVPMFRGVDRYLVAKDGEIGYLTGSLGVEPGKVIKFPNVGVDTLLFKPSGGKTAEPSLLYVGRMPKRARSLGEKSPWLLLGMMAELVKSLPEATLRMVGDGPGMEDLREAAKAEGLGRSVAFHGYVDNRLLPPIYSSSWATFIPLRLEGIDPFWDGSLKESMACSTPVIGFNEGVGGYADSRQRLGHLIPPDPVRGAEILVDILRDRARLEEAGEMGRGEVLGCCSWESVIGGLERVYLSLLRGGSV